MKHEKEWHTCDRRGTEIENESRSTFLKKCYRIGGIFVNKATLLKVVDFDLCPKCRKDFERFMKNE